MAIARFLESNVFGPSGFLAMAPLRCTAKLYPFLSLDCAPTPSTLAQSKERKGSNFAIWQPRRKLGFTIEEGKLIHHNGIVTCRAEYGDNVQEEMFHLVFSFAPPVIGLTTPEITTGSKRFDEGAISGWNKGPSIKGSSRQRKPNNTGDIGSRDNLDMDLTVVTSNKSQNEIRHWIMYQEKALEISITVPKSIRSSTPNSDSHRIRCILCSSSQIFVTWHPLF